MATIAVSIERLLRGQTPARSAGVELLAWIGWIGLGGCLYGAVMGTFGGVTGERFWQVVYSSTKVPLLLWATFFLTLPSFFVLNSLSVCATTSRKCGKRCCAPSRPRPWCWSPWPYTALRYLTSGHYNEAILFNRSCSRRRASRPKFCCTARIARSWPAILRHGSCSAVGSRSMPLSAFRWVGPGPFIGDPNAPTRFFREGAWGNAYVIVAEMIYGVVQGWLK